MGSRKTRLANEDLRVKQAAVELKERADARQALADSEKSRINQSVVEAKERVEEKLALQNSIAAFLNEKNIEHKAMTNAQLQSFDQYNTDRQNSETARQQETTEFLNNVKAKVQELCQSVQMSLGQFRAAHVEMLKSLQREFQEQQNSRLSAEKDRQNTAAELAKELATNFWILQQGTGELLKSFKDAHQEMSSLQQESLNIYIQNMKATDASFRQQAELDRQNRLELLYDLLDLDFGIKKKVIKSTDEPEIVQEPDEPVVASPEPETTVILAQPTVEQEETLFNETPPETVSDSIEVPETPLEVERKIYKAGQKS